MSCITDDRVLGIPVMTDTEDTDVEEQAKTTFSFGFEWENFRSFEN